MLRNYIKTAWRNLLKNKVTSFINIAGLAVGMGVAIMIGLWIYDELSFNKYHTNYETLAQVYNRQTFNGKTGAGRAISIPLRNELQTKYGEDFKNLSLASWSFNHILSTGDKKIISDGMFVDSVFPQMFSLQMLKGSQTEALNDPSSIILSESMAKALFGDEEPMGKLVKVDNDYSQQVTGVFKDLPFNTELTDNKYFIPWSKYTVVQQWVNDARDQWNNHSFQLFTQLNKKENLAAVSAKIKDVELLHNKDGGNPQLFLHPMNQWHLFSEFKDGINVGGRIQFVWLFGIIGIFVLLLACINFMNLSTARSEKRAREVGIRKSIGSMRRQLIFQFLSESLLVVFFAALFAVGLVLLMLPVFNQLADKQMQLPWSQPFFWIAILLFTLITGLLAGSYPAFYLSSFNPLKVLKGTFRVGRWASVPRKVLVVLQFTVSVALIIGTIVIFNQIQHAKNRPVNYSRDGLIQIPMNTPQIYGHYNALRDDLLKSGAVYEMSQSSSPVTDVWSNQIGWEWEGKDPNTTPLFGYIGCTHDFGKTVGWEIVQGRDFSRDYPTDSAGLIFNEEAVKLSGIKDIIGKTIRKGDASLKVIGVVKNMVMESPYKPVKPTIFRLSYGWASIINVKLQPGMPEKDALKKVEAVFARHDPGSPFEFKFTDDQYDAKFRTEERVGNLARVFTILAIFISCLGLLGLSAYVAEQRTKEIGIRKVLGASVSQLWMLLSKDFVLLICIACLIAAPVTLYFLDNWLDKYEYRVQLSWMVFVAASLMAIMITLATVSFQAIKAAVANPVRSLRTE